MNKKQCLALEHNKPFIIENIDGKRLLDLMVEKNIFSTDDDEEIREAGTRKLTAEKFYDKLLKSKHGDAYTTFKTALNQNGDTYIVKELEKIEQKYAKVPDENLPDPRRAGVHAGGNSVYVSGHGNTVIAGGQHVTVNNTFRR
ncbi:uncharacterized protein LOC117123599 [Anneissia japonica]|uniref:uncharacterized protein LOC117123599 n=1 Tax=Anneissia japonica TaxID=1529436 RepID=UPI001425B807|nr:uncharacterized protein LOC117123599 [Anneissia japonica]